MRPELSCATLETTANTDFSKCVICQRTSDEHLATLTEKGVASFTAAMNTREDEVHDRLCALLHDREDFLKKSPKYHRSCRSEYIHKKDIERLTQARPVSVSTDKHEYVPSKNRCLTNIDYKACCFICRKQRDSKGKWELFNVSTDERQAAIHANAKELGDESLLTLIEGHGDSHLDMTAKQFKYHRHCMSALMLRENTQSLIRPSTSETDHNDIYEDAFHELISEIEIPLIKSQSVYYLVQLRNRFRDLLKNRGVDIRSDYKSTRTIRRLKKYFGQSIQIISQKGQRTIVCSSGITVSDMCRLASKLKNEMHDSMFDTDTDSGEDDDNAIANTQPNLMSDTYAVAKCVRHAIKDKQKYHRLDETVLELSYQHASNLIPDGLYNLIALIITNDKEAEITALGRVQVTHAVHEKILNIAQDIMARVTNIPMPKNTGLALHVLRQTRSKYLIQILNRFGHSISYDDAQRCITSMAEKVELQILDQGIFIPSSLCEGAFIHCAFDNLDFHEDTKDGSTLHAISHNIYQYEQNRSNDTAVLPPKHRARSIASQVVFTKPDSSVTLSIRKKARSLADLDLSNVTALSDTTVRILHDDTFIWALLRQQCCSIDGPPTTSRPLSWNEYFERQINIEQDKTTIAYGPLFPQSPTDPDAVQASLDYFVNLTSRMGQDTTVVTCDQAIYDIVRGIMHRYPDKYGCLVVRLGGFHIAENFLGAIGFVMKGSGIEDILVDGGVCLRGTTNKVISGKDYYKMVRCHSLVCEVMIGLLWKSFLEWLEHMQINTLNIIVHLNTLHQAFSKTNGEATISKLNELKLDLIELEPAWKEFHDQLSVTAKYWLTYINMVLILRKYIWAERAGDWNCHLSQVKEMLPYLIGAGHSKYASCVPLYLTDMHKLAESNPEVNYNFLRGQFTVHRTSGKFNGIWSDLALEQTYNKEGKTSLLKGVSPKPVTREKYVRTAPYMTQISESVKAMAHVEDHGSSHHGDSSKATEEEFGMVRIMQDLISSKMIDPFSVVENQVDLFNISTGEKCSSNDLVNIKQLGLDALMEANTNNAEKVKIPKIQTFVGKKTPKSSRTPLTKIYQDETAVTRALCFIQHADESTRNDAFSHEWTNYPSSLFKPIESTRADYGMRRGNKADFLAALLAVVDGKGPNPQVDVLLTSDQPTAYFIDMMAFVQRYQKLNSRCFAELPYNYLQLILRMRPHNCKHIHIIGDRYDVDKSESLKADERDHRTAGSQSKEYIPSDAVEIPDWKELLGNPKNKANMLNYISEHICDHREMIPDDITIVLGGTFLDNGKCVCIQNGVQSDIKELSCNQHEEADTRIFAHLSYCANVLGIKRAVISCTDTDIIILSMYHNSLLNLGELWIQKGTAYLAVHHIVAALSTHCDKDVFSITNTLLSAYVLSGCDTTSYPFRRGKRQAALVALSVIGSLSAIGEFGTTDDVAVTESVMSEARLFFTTLYGKKYFASLDLLRQHMFATSNSDLRLLPPTEDTFKYHTLRCLYQLLIYHRAHLSDLRLPPPTSFGRKLDQQGLVPIMGTKSPKPNKIKAISCKCKSSRCLRNCICAKSNMKCFIGCLCLGSSETCGRITPQCDSDSE